MPNGSLDFHLFNPNLDFLPWATRYKISLGLSSALLYLHKEWEQSVVRRDIKCSIVMLGLNFNPKLGDFGLARLTDHDTGLQTTTVAGTPGYLAPECLLTGKASKEFDVYSFGIAALEIACGRKVLEVKEEASKVNLVGWVWDLYGKGLILEAVDKRLEGEFDERQAECLMIVGLCCSHPDASCRPTIKQAITTLNFETALPSLPPQLPVPVYVLPGMNMSLYSSYVSTDNYFDTSANHIGIDLNSIESVAYVNVTVGLKNITGHTFISYDSTTKNLSVSLTVEQTSTPYVVSLSYAINLSTILPEIVQVGFSASTGTSVELHKIFDWSFNSTLEAVVSPSPTPTPTVTGSSNKTGLVVGISVGLFLFLIIGLFIVWRIILRKKNLREAREGEIEATQFDIDEDFDEEVAPKRFAYSEISRATNNFSIEGMLGEGGFRGVYKGVLEGPGGKEIVVKKIKSGSRQGKKEYISEVKIISRLRNGNLVQLLGWCHDRGELLLVYEFMPNRSLESHLFNPRLDFLPWETRYKIALGLSSALLYLHEEWEQSVVHKDIKCSNVMLDLNFNLRLGDFGLARLTDHDAGLQNTAVAGTPGYLAPECLLTGKFSKESDVYNFGIAALEIACGRKIIEGKEEEGKLNLTEWVWDLYGKGIILEAVDYRLEGEFDERQAECLMIFGLWCSHPDASCRPSIKQAITTLNLETPLPSLPPQLPVPIYVSSGMNNMSYFSSYVPSNMTEGSYTYTSGSSINTSTTKSSLESTSNTHPLLGGKQ